MWNFRLKEKLLFIAAIIAVAIFLFIVLSGCSAAQKAQRQEKKIQKAAQYLLSVDALDELCEEVYPVRDSIIKGDSVLLFDTLYIEGEIITDTLIEKDTVRIVTTKTLPSKTITKTAHVIDTIVRENTAAVNACNDDKRKLIGLLEKKTIENEDWKDKAKKRFWVIVGLMALIFLIIGYNIYRIKNKITKL